MLRGCATSDFSFCPSFYIAAQEDRDLTDQDVIKFNGLKSRIDATSAAIDRESALISEQAPMGIHAGTGYASEMVSDNRELDPKQ